MSDYYCPNCDSDLGDQPGFDPSEGTWTCKVCGSFLMDEDIDSGCKFSGVAWHCDSCNALLNRQSGFSDIYDTWTCTKCGHTNGITEDDIVEEEHQCPNCNSNLKKQWRYSEYTYDYTCSECGANLHREYSSDPFKVIEEEDTCPECGASLLSQSGYYDYLNDYTCSECDAVLHRDNRSDPFKVVEEEDTCPECGASLLSQSGYYDSLNDYTCSECGAELHRDYYGEPFSVAESDNTESNQYYSFTYNNTTRSNASYEDDIEKHKEFQHRTEENRRKKQEQECREEEYRRLILEQELKEREQAFRAKEKRKERILLIKETVVLFFAILFRKKVEIPFSSEQCKGKDYSEVFYKFLSAGFLRVEGEAIEDLNSGSSSLVNTVKGVSINRNSSFNALERACITSKIKIYFHAIHTEIVPVTNHQARKMDVDQVRSLFIDSDFENVLTVALHDLKPRQIKKKDKKVAVIMIDGNKEYRKKSKVKINSEIIIKYHSPK